MRQESAPASIFNPDGSINEDTLTRQYGLGLKEASQRVTFGGYQGTVAEMLNDSRCPVGGMVRTAFQETGIEGVVKQFELLGQMDKNFKIEIDPSTIEQEQGKKR